MTDDSAAMAADNGSDKRKSRGRKVRLLSLDDLDGRTLAAQFVKDTREEIISDLVADESQLSTLERLAVENVALTAAMIRDAGVKWLQGDEIDPGTCRHADKHVQPLGCRTRLAAQGQGRDAQPDRISQNRPNDSEKPAQAINGNGESLTPANGQNRAQRVPRVGMRAMSATAGATHEGGNLNARGPGRSDAARRGARG